MLVYMWISVLILYLSKREEERESRFSKDVKEIEEWYEMWKSDMRHVPEELAEFLAKENVYELMVRRDTLESMLENHLKEFDENDIVVLDKAVQEVVGEESCKLNELADKLWNKMDPIEEDDDPSLKGLMDSFECDMEN